MTITLVKVGRQVLPGQINTAAADTVLRHAFDVADARDLLEAIGLVAPGGRELLPDDTREYDLELGVKAPSAKDPDPWSPIAFAEHGRRPDGMTTPPGLATLPPVAPAAVKPERKARPSTPTTAGPPKKRRTAVCGEPSGYVAHRRRKEPTCPACRAAVAERQRQYMAARRERALARAPQARSETARLIAAGVNPETAAVLDEHRSEAS